MAPSEPSRTLRLVERATPVHVGGSAPEVLACCPHYRTHKFGERPVAVCDAMPMFAPVSQDRAQSHCLSACFASCPHFVYRTEADYRAQAEAEPVAVAKRWTFQTIRESGWVVGIPLCLVLFIVIALLLTQ